MNNKTGKHWAVECAKKTHYINRDHYTTPEEAEARWRDIFGLYFIDVVVRPTTLEEDARLQQGEEELQRGR